MSRLKLTTHTPCASISTAKLHNIVLQCSDVPLNDKLHVVITPLYLSSRASILDNVDSRAFEICLAMSQQTRSDHEGEVSEQSIC